MGEGRRGQRGRGCRGREGGEAVQGEVLLCLGIVFMWGVKLLLKVGLTL